MKARIIKKLSKKLVAILPKIYGDVHCSPWVDNEIMDEAWEQGSRVSGCFRIGGHLDEWGEGTDDYTVFHDFKNNLLGWQGLWGFYDEDSEWEDMPKGAPYRLTGQKLIMLAKQLNKGNR